MGRWRPLRGSYSIDFFSFEQTICPWFQCPLLVEQAAPTIYELSDISVESTIQPSNKERSCFSYPSCCNTWCNTCPNTVVFFSQYGNQVNINSQQRQLVNGVPVSARDACFSSNNENNHPSNKDFYSLLPEALQNVTIGGWGLVTYWIISVNSTNSLLYEVWNVGYFSSNSTQTLSHVEILFKVNCSLPKSNTV